MGRFVGMVGARQGSALLLTRSYLVIAVRSCATRKQESGKAKAPVIANRGFFVG